LQAKAVVGCERDPRSASVGIHAALDSADQQQSHEASFRFAIISALSRVALAVQ
jgi:hypothetical protein